MLRLPQSPTRGAITAGRREEPANTQAVRSAGTCALRRNCSVRWLPCALPAPNRPGRIGTEPGQFLRPPAVSTGRIADPNLPNLSLDQICAASTGGMMAWHREFPRHLGETTQFNHFSYQSFFANIRLIGPNMGRGLFGEGSGSGLTGGARHGSCKNQTLSHQGALCAPGGVLAG